MNKKHVAIAMILGVAVGYMLQNVIAKVPVVNKLPVIGGAKASA